jgi:hypothetical protein
VRAHVRARKSILRPFRFCFLRLLTFFCLFEQDAVKMDGCGRLCNMTFYADLMAQAGSAFETENCEFACPRAALRAWAQAAGANATTMCD